jgi:hypothetical protein
LDETVPLALLISLVGMTLLFLALGFFYVLLSLITKVLRDPDSSAEPAEEQRPVVAPDSAPDKVLRAAAIGVALARAQAEENGRLRGVPQPGETTTGPEVSPWWALHHQRHVASHPKARRVQ